MDNNVALNKTAVSSTYKKLATSAKKAFDGNASTSWSSVTDKDEWIYVDLGRVRLLDRVVLNWISYATSYEIQVSDDLYSWETLYSTTTGDGGTDDIELR